MMTHNLPPPYTPKSRMGRWVDDRLPLPRLIHRVMTAPTPRTLNWWWVWGMVLMVCLIMQIVTGIALAMHYIPDTSRAFASVEAIMRDVNAGYALRYVHRNGASLFFFAVYLHIARSLYYGSYKSPRELTWLVGMMLYGAMMATAFMGYVLPWGQMSYWAATVITGLFGTIPVIGPAVQSWILGGPSVGDPTLMRFYILHIVMPFVMLGLMVLHIWGVHHTGNSAPTGCEPRGRADTLPFWPWFALKDLFALALVMTLFAAVTAFLPDYLSHPDNYIQANPLVTPAHIQPEWYFLPFYAILRSFTPDVWLVIALDGISFGTIDAKLVGAMAMFGSLGVLAMVPWLDRSPLRAGDMRKGFRIWFWLLVVDFAILIWAGAQPSGGIGDWISLGATAYWFGYFLIVLPLLSRSERRRLPQTSPKAPTQ